MIVKINRQTNRDYNFIYINSSLSSFSIYLSLTLFIYLSFYFFNLPIYIFIYLSHYLSLYLCIYPGIHYYISYLDLDQNKHPRNRRTLHFTHTPHYVHSYSLKSGLKTVGFAKGTVDVISRDPSFEELHIRFTTVSFYTFVSV